MFGRSYAAEPDRPVAQLREDEADTLLLTVPNPIGVACNTRGVESVLKHVAPALGRR